MSFTTNAVIVKADPTCVCGSDELVITGDVELDSVTCEQCGAPGSIFDVLTGELDGDNVDHVQLMVWMAREATMMEREA